MPGRLLLAFVKPLNIDKKKGAANVADVDVCAAPNFAR
jgi:hypothetical protein